MTDMIQSTSTPTSAVRARNKEILFAALAEAGITKVSIEFDGAGDSGQIEDILVWNAAGETIPPPSDRNLEPPPPVVESTLTCLVPALNEVVVHIGSCRPDYLDIGVVPMALGVTRCSCGSGGQIDPADERHFGRLSCIDQPTLLVMEVAPVRAIPTSLES